jgi:hypothetical protein
MYKRHTGQTKEKRLTLTAATSITGMNCRDAHPFIFLLFDFLPLWMEELKG